MTRDTLFMASQVLQVLAAGMVGLLAGALLAEGALLLPYWRTLSAQAFYELHPVYGPRLFRFFAPLTIAAPALSTLAAAASQAVEAQGRWHATAAAALAWSLVGIYFAHFRKANDSFARRAVSAGALPGALARWAAWHRARTGVGVLAFGFCLLAIAAE